MKPASVRRDIITSRQNPLVQRARAVRDGRDRQLILIEGVRLCEEAARAHLPFQLVFHLADEEGTRLARLLDELRARGAQLVPTNESVLASISDTRTSQGIVALAPRPAGARERLETDEAAAAPLLVIMHRVNNPANAGAMLRVAEAAGATGAIATRGSTDLFSPKALRGSMGSAFRLPLWTGPDISEVFEWCRARRIRTVGTAAQAPARHTELDWTGARAILVGPEAGGLAAAELGATDESVRIPMRAPVESLNVAVALAVILYEAARQRRFA